MEIGKKDMNSFQTSYTKSLDKKIQNRKNLTHILKKQSGGLYIEYNDLQNEIRQTSRHYDTDRIERNISKMKKNRNIVVNIKRLNWPSHPK